MNCISQLYASVGGDSSSTTASTMANYLSADVSWCVAHPVNDLSGPDAIHSEFFTPLLRALPDLERKPFIEVPGIYQGQHWVAGTGYFIGTFNEDLFGIPATGRTLYLRYTELVRIADGKIDQCYLIPDFLDAMTQAGVYPLRPGLGHPGLIMPPSTHDGMCALAVDPEYSQTSIQLVMDMLDCLRKYDGVSLESMDLENYWHPDFMWYGPGGIGTTRGIAGFRQHHQGPFLKGFPDRDVDHHACTVASGDYIATGGWPHMHGTHSGGDWLGLPPSGTRLSLRVMDVWRRQGDLLKENWVAIDIPHMLSQMGLDVFQQMKAIK